MNDIITGNFVRGGSDICPLRSIRVVDWNIDRGLRLPGIVEFLASQRADLLLLQEVDLNARRTRCINVAEEIARKLGMHYVFGREFQELTQGSPRSPAFHGQATLSRWPLKNARVIHFRRQSNFWRPRWFLPRTEPFQERIGGRIALVTEIELVRKRLALYNLHLESRGDDDLRRTQLKDVLLDAAKRPSQAPVLVAGDLNFDGSSSFYAFDAFGRSFQSALEFPSPPTTPARGLFQRGRTIDWAFVSGLEADLGRVHSNIDASDHYPISVTIRFG